MKKLHAFMLFGIVFTALNSLLLQHWRIGYLNNQLHLAEMQSNINVEWANELLWARINDVHDVTKDQLVAQGRIEGIVSYLNGDNAQDMNELWHEGYMRGLTQSDYQYDVIAENEYSKGYNAALQQAFPNNPELVNEDPRGVKKDAIETPNFDKDHPELEGNEQVIESLNAKIKEIKNEE